MQIDHPILQFKNVSISYTPGKNAVNHVNADIKKNRITAIMGPSGCGKSTLLRAINRMHELYPDIRISGEILMDKPDKKDLDGWHIRKASRLTGRYMSKFCGWLPPEKAWSDFVYNLVRHCKGRVRYYEIVNEPNLFMSPENYTRYLKLAYDAAKKADPSCRIVGICSTGDLGGRLGDFIEACGKLGAFRSLDILSFHPYSAQLDSYPTPAEAQLRAIRCRLLPT